jgi:hypothetical protein
MNTAKNSLAVMDATGDTKTLWDPKNKDEVEIARETFDRFKKKGYLIYSTDKEGAKGEKLTEFDKTIGRMIAVPPIAGG